MLNFKILASLDSWADCSESYMVGNLLKRFWRREYKEERTAKILGIYTINYMCTIPDPKQHMGKWQNTGKHPTQESQEVSPFPAGDHKAARYRQDTMTTINK